MTDEARPSADVVNLAERRVEMGELLAKVAELQAELHHIKKAVEAHADQDQRDHEEIHDMLGVERNRGETHGTQLQAGRDAFKEIESRLSNIDQDIGGLRQYVGDQVGALSGKIDRMARDLGGSLSEIALRSSRWSGRTDE